MNYNSLKTLAYAYADRQDQEALDRYDDFLRITETRIDKTLKVSPMSTRTQVQTQADQMYYALPTDFLGLRDIEIADPSDVRKTTTLHFVTPEQMNLVTSTQNTEQLVSVGAIYYSIVADQLQIFPTSSNLILEVVYYVRVPDLTPTAANNWVSDDHSDLYLFGVLTEISAWVKDQAATQLWDTRFRAALDDLRQDDAKARWSGPPLIMRTT